MGLKKYQSMRDFGRTREPRGRAARSTDEPRFVVQEHHASHLHWDFRLEMGGVLKSWSVPRGPSLDPSTKRLAVEVEDHPVGYMEFTGSIPAGSYGAGEVYRWDMGGFTPEGDDPLGDLARGKLLFALDGDRLKGRWRLVRMNRRDGGKPVWLLQKAKDEHAVEGHTAELVGETPARTKRSRAPVAAKASGVVAKGASGARRRSPRGVIGLEDFLALERASGDVTVEVDGHRVALTSLDRVYYPEPGITKHEVLAYYARMAPRLLPYLADRPAILERFPRGVSAPGFFQHDLPGAPDYVRTRLLTNEHGRKITYAVYSDLASLLYLVNLAALELHPWHSRVQSLARPDWLVLDLDPHGAPWENVVASALAVREALEKRGLRGYAKTSGSSGVHAYVPLDGDATYARVAQCAHEVALEVAAKLPSVATVERSLASRRRGQVYVDWLQNARGKTAAAPYTLRARPLATVSMPLTWAELEAGARIEDFTLGSVLRAVTARGYDDPWAEMLGDRQALPRAAKKEARRR